MASQTLTLNLTTQTLTLNLGPQTLPLNFGFQTLTLNLGIPSLTLNPGPQTLTLNLGTQTLTQGNHVGPIPNPIPTPTLIYVLGYPAPKPLFLMHMAPQGQPMETMLGHVDPNPNLLLILF